MSIWFWLITIVFTLVSVGMILIILVQRPQGGGLAGAFGGAGGSGTETVFGGRVGDALTFATVAAFVLFLGLAIALNLMDDAAMAGPTAPGPTPPGALAPGGEEGATAGEGGATETAAPAPATGEAAPGRESGETPAGGGTPPAEPGGDGGATTGGADEGRR